MPVALIALLAAVLPTLAVHLAYAISIHEGFSPACIPYIDGCTSISAAARNGNALFLFRGIVIPCSVLLVLYWRVSQLWLQSLDTDGKRYRAMFYLGATGSVFLILYADFLGSHGDAYRFMRRYGIFMFFGLSPLAMMLQVRSLRHLAAHHSTLARHSRLLSIKLAFCFIMLGCGLVSVGADWLGMKSYELGSALEWVFALFLFSYFLITAWIWHSQDLRLSLNTP